ncbi:MAG TPA: hypothetical protein VMW75_06515, partial [Thermoanaerobaculia bacterium]|nr:hypothetical protein [Thermoanaerobaculia bacterium]
MPTPSPAQPPSAQPPGQPAGAAAGPSNNSATFPPPASAAAAAGGPEAPLAGAVRSGPSSRQAGYVGVVLARQAVTVAAEADGRLAS